MKWDDAKEREHWELERQLHAHSLSVVDVFQGMPGRVHEAPPPMTDAEWAVERERIQSFRAEFLASRRPEPINLFWDVFYTTQSSSSSLLFSGSHASILWRP